MTVNGAIAFAFASIGAVTEEPTLFASSDLDPSWVGTMESVVLDTGSLATFAVLIFLLTVGALWALGGPNAYRDQTPSRASREAERRHRANVEAQLHPRCPCGAPADHFRSMPQRTRGRLCLSCHLDGRVPPRLRSVRPQHSTATFDHSGSSLPAFGVPALGDGAGGSDGGDGGGD